MNAAYKLHAKGRMWGVFETIGLFNFYTTDQHAI